MGQAKNIEIRPISKSDANNVVRQIHYSGKVDPRSQLHFGVFYQGKCHGAMQFGPSIDKSKMIGMVRDTHWNGFLELNRMAFADSLPKNSESRALGVVFRLIKKEYPHIKWIVSFSDGTQCGDGAIYRASGFLLTQIKKNSAMWRMPDGEVICQLSLKIGGSGALKRRVGMIGSETFGMFAKRIGAVKLPGFQLRYLKILDESYRSKIACDILPFSEIETMGAKMYRGKPLRAESKAIVAPEFHSGEGCETQTSALHLTEPEQKQP